MPGNFDQLESTDPLLACLLLIAWRYNQSFTKSGLIAGLPILGDKIDHNSFLRAAARANFGARKNKIAIGKLYSMHLPVILILKNNDACILERIEKKYAYITRPSNPQEEEKINMLDLKDQYSGQLYELKHTFKPSEEAEGKSPHGHWLWRILIKQMPTYTEVALASLLVNIFALASPLFIMNVYDKVIPNQAFETLWTLALAVLLALIFDFIMRELRTYFIDYSSRNVDSWFSATLFEQLLDIKMAARPDSIGPLINSVQSFESIKDFISSTTIVAIVDFPFVITFLLIIYILGGWLVLIPLSIIPLVLLFNYINQLQTTALVTKIVKLNSQKQAILIETLQNIATVKLSLSEGTMQHRWEDIIDAIAKLGVRNRFFANFSLNLSVFAQYIASVGIVIGGVYRVSSGNMRLGELIACSILAGRALVPAVQLSGIISKYKQAKASLELINKILELPVERPEHKSFLMLPTFHGNIEFKDVAFRYPNQKTEQLEHVTFAIKPKEHVGIIGLNGSGKTTLLRLILKLYEPSKGSISLDGMESSQLDPSEVRKFIGFVPQDVALFQGTVKDNVKMGTTGIDDQTLIEAANLSGLSRFIKEHPEGFHRDVGEGGRALSGGERQIIGLARALLTNPPVLMMDEPTNHMDETAVVQFTQNLAKWAKDRTLILVTHKLDLLNLVDRLLVMHRGRLVADGPRDVVLEKLQIVKGKA